MVNNNNTTFKPYNLREYGSVKHISLFHVLFILDFVIPSFRLLSLIGLRFKHVIIFNLCLDNEEKKGRWTI